MEFNFKNTFFFNSLDFVIPSSAVFLFIRPVPHWSLVSRVISRNHSITRFISFPKKVEETTLSSDHFLLSTGSDPIG
jgi:hypothetical protein